MYNIIAPICPSQMVGTGCITPPDPLSGFGDFNFKEKFINIIFRCGLSRRPGSEGLKFINRALSRIVVASYLPPSSVSVPLEVLYAEGSLLINFSLSLIKYLIPTNSNRIINLYSLWGSCNGLS